MAAWVDHQLPDEVSLRIFNYLDARELNEASLVSRAWLRLTHDQAVVRVEHLGVTEWRAYCRDRAAFERVRETAVSRADPGTAFIFAPASSLCSTRLFEEGYVNNAIVALETEVRRHPMSADAWALMGKAHAENDQDGDECAQPQRSGGAREPGNLPGERTEWRQGVPLLRPVVAFVAVQLCAPARLGEGDRQASARGHSKRFCLSAAQLAGELGPIGQQPSRRPGSAHRGAQERPRNQPQRRRPVHHYGCAVHGLLFVQPGHQLL
ncbi:F-box domain containing protein [Acanthamoeba castellanii str. Neff]|uniref:F-box domain containing protein n=1 Tax=Acanthamoeba castellanii (strain ATCC 30010 / Neff) TaxID=1257118 RepID=L8GNY1_ACACF|nr:F-box domain containing protein [Acanthamoeba castellanii str. Neff]ELR14884.1 F-box domain containing protein [Acanthamoeba castellanii str. Neff]